MKRVEGKVAIVTGAAGGIGFACAELLAEEGATVVLTDVNAAGAAAADGLAARGLRAAFVHHDVAAEADWDRVVADTVERFGRLDVVVNNAGIARIADVESETLDGWRQTQAVNLDGVFLGTQRAIRAMKTQPGVRGSIVNVSSIEGIIGESMVAAYNASKGGVRIFTKSAALHCARNGLAIRVNSVHPGFVATRMVLDNPGLPPEAAQAFAAELINHRIPVRRFGEPREIAYGVLFLASDESSYMTGSELVIDGGYTAQ